MIAKLVYPNPERAAYIAATMRAIDHKAVALGTAVVFEYSTHAEMVTAQISFGGWFDDHISDYDKEKLNTTL